jgi:hypothetical protein
VYDGDAATTIPDFDGFSPAVDFGHGTIDTESADTAGSFDNNGAHNRDNNNGSSALVARPIPINIVAGGAANSFAAAQRVRARLSAVGPTADRSGGPEFILRPGRHMIYKVAFNSVQPEPLARLFVYTGPHSDPLPGFYLFVAGPLHENMRYYEERGPDPRELRNYAWHCPVLSVPAGDLPPSIASVPSIPSGLIASPITFAAGETSSAAGAASSSFDLTPRSVFEYSSDDGEDEDGSDAEIDSDGDDGNSDDLGVSSLIEPIDIPGASPIVFSPPRPAAAVDVAVNSNHWHPGLHITEHTPHGNANGNANVLDGHVSGAGHGEAASNVDALRNLCRSIPAPTAAVERPRDLFCSWEPLYRSSEWADDVIVNAFQSGLGQLEGSLRFEHL